MMIREIRPMEGPVLPDDEASALRERCSRSESGALLDCLCECGAHGPGAGPGRTHQGDHRDRPAAACHRGRGRAVAACRRPGDGDGLLRDLPLLPEPGRPADHADHRRLQRGRHGRREGRRGVAGRWLAACRAVREWALAHPHEYALVYGSPVPGYQAPERTIEPASRAAAVFGKIISDAYRAGAAEVPVPAKERAGGTVPGPPVPESFVPDAARLRDAILAGVPDEVAAGALIAWAGLFGLVSFELFGQFENVVTDRAAFFDHAATRLGVLI